ncbi:MAG TPA: Ku protein [Kofleriaceae bacterium]|nr:Ku protein [Kofleriaceae bacterium]
MAARAIASGSVSFGLVSIPVKLYTTNETAQAVSFNMVHGECGSRLKQQYVCPTCETTVDRSQMAKGYEFSKGQFVILDAEEIKALEAVSNNAIELTEFVPRDEVDPLYFEKSYYLGPDKGGERAYMLLGEAMNRTGLIGLARYSARGKQYLVLLRPYGDNGLILHQLRYADEIKPFAEVPIQEPESVNAAELKLAIQIIEQISTDAFTPEKYEDTVKKKVLDLIQQKIDGQEITAAPEAPQAQVIDLMEALKRSLGGAEDAAAETGKAKKAKGAKAAKAAAPAKKKRAAKG